MLLRHRCLRAQRTLGLHHCGIMMRGLTPCCCASKIRGCTLAPITLQGGRDASMESKLLEPAAAAAPAVGSIVHDAAVAPLPVTLESEVSE